MRYALQSSIQDNTHHDPPDIITMETCYRTLWMTVVLASITWISAAVGPVIRCEPCDAGARLLCKPLPKDCAERVRETGCGCCMTCALAFGQRCGVYTGRCGSGMTCQQQPGETKPLQALLEGRGQCANVTIKRPTASLPAINEIQENVGGTQEEEQNTTAPVIQAPQALFSTSRPHVVPPRVPHHPSPLHPIKAEVIRREQLKRAQSYKMEELPGAHSTDQQNFSLESKQEPVYGPCLREMESILKGLKITDILNPRGFHIPNCDNKGFYNKRQCRPSKGRKRGFCWCVDKYGQPLPGFNGKERGDAQCYNSESQ
ncbi:insulin-like growth factor-binding protein 3 isoform X2 [Coregonus clupeaformis]|uniref:Insulin-like growth factor-binding protein 3 n=1 Tax=Coregonus suidteri TaxID=861788 RepID=A0AAN8LK00_9TELE|nr:insulin-like growth factor-binding protein 3 isoform X2 [Coregonus clupeaformis]